MLWIFSQCYSSIQFFKLCSSKVWLFLEFDCLKYYNGNGKVRKIFYDKISDTTTYDDSNQDKDLECHVHISLAKDSLKFVQALKIMIYVVVSGREAIFLFFYMVQVIKGRYM